MNEETKNINIYSIGRIGKLTVWHHVGRRYFNEIVVNIDRELVTQQADVAHYLGRKDFSMLIINIKINDLKNQNSDCQQLESDQAHYFSESIFRKKFDNTTIRDRTKATVNVKFSEEDDSNSCDKSERKISKKLNKEPKVNLIRDQKGNLNLWEKTSISLILGSLIGILAIIVGILALIITKLFFM